MEEVREFTTEEPVDRDALLAEAIEIVQYADVELGSESVYGRNPDEAKGVFVKQLKRLGQEQAEFAPRLDVHRLTLDAFEEQGIAPSRELKARMQENDFYQVSIPITLFPRSGWAFTRLECFVTFCPEGETLQDCPIVHEMFPDDVWTEILSLQDHLSLGLDENFQFRAQVDPVEGKWKALSGAAQAKLALRVGGGAQLVVGPFTYRIRRAEVRGRGRGNVKSFWRLGSQADVDEEDVRLGVILMVPRGRAQPVNAEGELRAYHDFQSGSADFFKDIWPHFGEALRAFFLGGAAVTGTMRWENITAKGAAQWTEAEPLISTAPNDIPSLSFERKEELVALLLACPTMRQRERRSDLLAHLPVSLAARIPNSSVDNIHVLNILMACLNYADGMQTLLEVLDLFEGDSIPLQQFKQVARQMIPGL